MCRKHVAFCDGCGTTWIRDRSFCGPYSCRYPTEIYDGSKLCSRHTRTLVHRPSDTSNRKLAYESGRLRTERDHARGEKDSLRKALLDIQATLSRTEKDLKESRYKVDKAEKSELDALKGTNYTISQLKAQFESSRNELEKSLVKSKKETSDVKDELKKTKEELDTANKSLTRHANTLDAAIRKEALKKALKKEFSRALFGR